MGVEKRLIGEILVEKGFCLKDDIEKGLNIQKNYEEDIKLGAILISRGVISEEQLMEALAEQFGLEYIKKIDDNIKFIDIGVKIELLVSNRIYPIEESKEYVKILTNNPLNIEIASFIENVKNKKVIFVLTTEDNLNQIENSIEEIVESKKIENNYIEMEEEIDKLKELASEAPVIKLVNSIFLRAVENLATDIHFESLKGGMRIRFRIDGILRTIDFVPNKLKLATIARLKLLSGMNIAESRLAQDGRISLRISGKNLDVRASSLPTQYGESFVLRLLLQENTTYQLEKLGFYSDHISIIRDIVSKPNGIFLTTGPTGSGKTTTLYSILSELNTEGVKIVTVEDPIEYELEGINQVQVKSEIGRTFAGALRNILRQDPDIIMIGEIRDLETAQIAVQASLTGHLVLSTLHTNSALSAITRLLDMGIEWFLIKASVIGLMAQRLVRTVCEQCGEDIDIGSDLIKAYGIDTIAKKYNKENISIKKGKGCEKCGYTGYKGRTVISEVVPFDFEVQKKFENNPSFNDINSLGYRSIYEDGILKVLDGKATIEEVLRVT